MTQAPNPPAGSHPDVERTIARYQREFYRKLRGNPARQIARVLLRRLRERRARRSDAASPAAGARTVGVPAILRPAGYFYRGFRGPWLEEHFYSTWSEPSTSGAAYLPVFFDSLFFHAQSGAFTPAEFRLRYRTLWQILFALGKSPRAYFTLLGMYEFPIWEWHLFPPNIVVAASAGYGDVPLPLLKGDRPRRNPPKDIRVSFMGALDGPSNVLNVRAAMRTAFAGLAHFGEGADWENVMGRSLFSLCPRGQGPTSFRLYEALSLTSIPVYIWKGRCWLPYADELDWSTFAIVVEAQQSAAARAQILALTPTAIRGMQERIAEVYPACFRYDAVCSRLRRQMDRVVDRADAERLAAGRANFVFGN